MRLRGSRHWEASPLSASVSLAQGFGGPVRFQVLPPFLVGGIGLSPGSIVTLLGFGTDPPLGPRSSYSPGRSGFSPGFFKLLMLLPCLIHPLCCITIVFEKHLLCTSVLTTNAKLNDIRFGLQVSPDRLDSYRLVQRCSAGLLCESRFQPTGGQVKDNPRAPVHYQKVLLLRDVPRENLRKGDRALHIHGLPGFKVSEDYAFLKLFSNSKAG